jgi:hypothetical protein
MTSMSQQLERDCVVLIEATIPADMTIAEWRRVRTRVRAMTRGARRRRVLESVR